MAFEQELNYKIILKIFARYLFSNFIDYSDNSERQESSFELCLNFFQLWYKHYHFEVFFKLIERKLWDHNNVWKDTIHLLINILKERTSGLKVFLFFSSQVTLYSKISKYKTVMPARTAFIIIRTLRCVPLV